MSPRPLVLAGGAGRAGARVSAPDSEAVTSARTLAVTALAVLLLACGKDKATGPRGDTTPPAAVTDLACIDSSGDSITLRWTAPGGNGSSGHAARYDLRYLHTPINVANWDSAAPAPAVAAPLAAGVNETITLYNRTWWTPYYFALKTADSAGNWSTVSNVTTATVLPDPNLRFLIGARNGTYVCDPNKHVTRFAEVAGEVEVLDDRIFVMTPDRAIYEFDAQGEQIDTVPVSEVVRSSGFVALPNERFALLNDVADLVYILDRRGRTLATVPMQDQADDAQQNVDGVVVGRALIVSEDGKGSILRIDLDTYAVSTARNLDDLPTHPGDIDYYRGRYYVCTDQRVYSFADSGDVALVGELNSLAITGIAVAGGYSFVTVDAPSAIYRLNNSTHTAEVFVVGLDHPQDIEILRR